MSYIEGVTDKVWIASGIEINAFDSNLEYVNSSDDASNKVFEYFGNKSGAALQNALKTVRSPFLLNNSKAMNYSIPVYKYQSTEINEDIHVRMNSMDYYWIRSVLSNSCVNVYRMTNTGIFDYTASYISDVGVRPCVTIKY